MIALTKAAAEEYRKKPIKYRDTVGLEYLDLPEVSERIESLIRTVNFKLLQFMNSF